MCKAYLITKTNKIEKEPFFNVLHESYVLDIIMYYGSFRTYNEYIKQIEINRKDWEKFKEDWAKGFIYDLTKKERKILRQIDSLFQVEGYEIVKFKIS